MDRVVFGNLLLQEGAPAAGGKSLSVRLLVRAS